MERFYIYCIRNLINGKIYVGKTNNPKDRWYHHVKIAKGGNKRYRKSFFAIHGSIRKYGTDNFKFEILEDFDDEKECYRYETWWIEYLGSRNKDKGYNLNYGGEGSMQPSPESRARMVAAQNKPELKKKRSEYMKEKHKNNPNIAAEFSERLKGNTYRKGTILTEEHKQKCSDSLRGRKFSEEHKRKIGLATCGDKSGTAKLTEVQVIEILEKYTYGEYSQRQLAKEYEIHFGTINDIILHKRWKHISEKYPLIKKTYSRQGEKSSVSKLTEKDVIEIINMYATGNFTYNKISKIFNVREGTIGSIIRRRVWKHVQIKPINE